MSEHSSVGRAFDCSGNSYWIQYGFGNQMATGSIPVARILFAFVDHLYFTQHSTKQFTPPCSTSSVSSSPFFPYLCIEKIGCTSKRLCILLRVLTLDIRVEIAVQQFSHRAVCSLVSRRYTSTVAHSSRLTE